MINATKGAAFAAPYLFNLTNKMSKGLTFRS